MVSDSDLCISPSAEEDAAIKAGIAADSDTQALDGAWFASAKPAHEALAPEPYAALLDMKRPRGCPKVFATKVFIANRLDAHLLETFKSTGKGWQIRVNAALRLFIEAHSLKP